MAGLLGTLHSAASGMTVSQTAIQTTSHNINNMNTPGYTRQRVEQSANRPFSQPGLNSYIGAGQLGTGVKASEVIRVRNSFYDYQYRSESHKYGDIAIKYDYYNNMENIFNEPSDDAISSNLNNFFTGWHELTKDP
ncbi:MAG: flagellar basal body protein, partial [Peptostreptococcaceae bacterium]